MNSCKEEIMRHQLYSIEFVSSLRALSEKEWRTEINEGKWTVAEVIGHFITWDDFVLNQRLPYVFSGRELPESPDSEKMNEVSASISREQTMRVTIDHFVSTRTALLNAIEEIPTDHWEVTFSIGTKELSLYEYFSELAQHDLHHFEQIKNILRL